MPEAGGPVLRSKLRRRLDNGGFDAVWLEGEHVDRFVGLGARMLYVSYDEWLRAGAAAYRQAITASSG